MLGVRRAGSDLEDTTVSQFPAQATVCPIVSEVVHLAIVESTFAFTTMQKMSGKFVSV